LVPVAPISAARPESDLRNEHYVLQLPLSAVKNHRFLRGGRLPKRARFTSIQELALVEATKKLNQLGDQARPSGLVARSEACPVVSMKVFVE
jgi:hypothetical protein